MCSKSLTDDLFSRKPHQENPSNALIVSINFIYGVDVCVRVNGRETKPKQIFGTF